MPDRVRCFVWMLKHDRLVTGERMRLFGIGNTNCGLCGKYNESTLHVFRECIFVKAIWENVVPNNTLHDLYHYDLQEWITLNLDGTATLCMNFEDDWTNFWAIACHVIWEWHNRDRHDDKFNMSFDMLSAIAARIHQYKVAPCNNIVMERNEVERLISWSLPNKDFVKINVDGVRSANGGSGCGGLL